MTCDPATVAGVAETLFDALEDDTALPDLSGITLPEFPAVSDDIFTNLPSITVDDLTEGKINGTGVFDRLMTSVTAHLDRERTQGRITNAEFAKSYVDFSSAAMGNAVQFLLQKDQAQWAAMAAQNQAKLVLIELTNAAIAFQTAKAQLELVIYQADQAKAQAALAKMALATAKVEYCTAEYNLSDILPKQALNLTAQKAQIEAQTDAIVQTTATLLPEQVRGAKEQADAQAYTTANIMPRQVAQINEQIKLVTEQVETQRAQTLDTRSDGTTPVTGTLGKQKELHAQQIVSYQRDSQLKAARPFIDAWITMKTIDEGTLPPTGFSNSNLDAVLGILRIDNDLM